MKRQLLVSLIATTATLSTFSANAFASSLVPQQEGEINVGLGCIDPDPNKCIEANSIPFIESIKSIEDDSTGNKSRLFVDDFSTANTYGSGTNAIQFQIRDAGTNPDEFWFRPSEHDANLGHGEENGQLEVGTFKFTFTQMLADLTIDFFDTESKNTTGVIAINGISLDSPDWVAKGQDSNIVSQTFFDITSITLKLGHDRDNGTGDGVDFKASSVDIPEPTALLGLLGIGLFGAVSKGKKEKN
ncbi:MAG: LEVG family PEP-CTERM protein [Spirulinaceae cyanobacterium]